MKNVIIVGCGAYMESGYGCPGEWRCMKAAALGEGNFSESVNVIGFVRCECPGRAAPPNVGLTAKMSGITPDAVHLSSCLVGANPPCPYFTADELVKFIEDKTGFKVEKKTHDYH
jgi:predicted metal-binding protein